MEIRFFKVRPKDHPFPLFAWIIMIFQGMNPFSRKAYSHMCMEFESETGNSKIIDFPFSGFREMKEGDYFKKYHIIEVKKRNFDITRKEFLIWLESHEHKKYDFLQIGGLILKILNLRKVNYSGGNMDKLVCSELIISFLVRFDKLKVVDSDNWDLIMSWDAI